MDRKPFPKSLVSPSSPACMSCTHSVENKFCDATFDTYMQMQGDIQRPCGPERQSEPVSRQDMPGRPRGK